MTSPGTPRGLDFLVRDCCCCSRVLHNVPRAYWVRLLHEASGEIIFCGKNFDSRRNVMTVLIKGLFPPKRGPKTLSQLTWFEC